MKKILCLFSVLLILVSSVACDGKGEVIDMSNYDERLTYIELTKIVTDPKNYVGNTIKFSGDFVVQENSVTGERSYLCVVTDTTQCCSSYLEFDLGEDAVYPDDYPKANTRITISGTLETYKRGSATLGKLVNVTVE